MNELSAATEKKIRLVPHQQKDSESLARNILLFDEIEVYLLQMIGEINNKLENPNTPQEDISQLTEDKNDLSEKIGKIKAIDRTGKQAKYTVGEFAGYIDQLRKVQQVPELSEEARVILYTLFPDKDSFQSFLDWVDKRNRGLSL